MKKIFAITAMVLAIVLTFTCMALADGAVDTTATDTTATDTNTTGSDVTAYDCGDVNGDSEIDAKDALAVLKHAVGKVTLTDVALVAADANADGDIDAKDALAILKYAVDKIDKLPDVAPVTGTDVTGTDATATDTNA